MFTVHIYTIEIREGGFRIDVTIVIMQASDEGLPLIILGMDQSVRCLISHGETLAMDERGIVGMGSLDDTGIFLHDREWA